MHSKSGAFSETLYVYEPAVEYVVKNALPPSFLSIGLGLGYVEILVFAYLLKHNSALFERDDFRIFSFEKEELLLCYFKLFFLNQSDSFFSNPNENTDEQLNFIKSYLHIIKLFCAHYCLLEIDLMNAIRSTILNEKIIFYNEFTEGSKIDLNFLPHAIFFDAFSPNSSPELWSDSCLNYLLGAEFCAEKSVFASYAANSLLKKTLKHNGFIIQKRTGFAGKRECVWGVRSLYKVTTL